MENTTAPQKEQGRGKMEACLKNGVESFKWTDDEIQLLLEVVKDYQSIQAQSNLDWMKIRSRYEQIAAKMRNEYPVAPLDERMRQGQSSYRSFFWTSSARSHGNGTERLRTVPLFVSLILSFHFLERNDVI